MLRRARSNHEQSSNHRVSYLELSTSGFKLPVGGGKASVLLAAVLPKVQNFRESLVEALSPFNRGRLLWHAMEARSGLHHDGLTSI